MLIGRAWANCGFSRVGRVIWTARCAPGIADLEDVGKGGERGGLGGALGGDVGCDVAVLLLEAEGEDGRDGICVRAVGETGRKTGAGARLIGRGWSISLGEDSVVESDETGCT